jgi:putative SOS response-associated peptidase YedK
MCGRFTLRTPATVLIEQFDLEVGADRQLELFEPRYNIAPTQEILVVRANRDNGRRTAATMRWGLIPSWTKQLAPGPPMINARAESLAEKPMFRTAFRQRRCLIPADGFYEWQKPTGGGRGKKQPFHIHRADNRPFAFAGLWDSWTSKADTSGDEPPLAIESCTIVTTTANDALRTLHDRMPVILAAGDYTLWLDPTISEPAALQHLLAPCSDDELVARPVSTRVNYVVNDDPEVCAELGMS